MAAAKAVVDTIAEEKLMDNATVVGGHFRARLDALKEKHRVIGDVRGMGLMQGLELVKDQKTKEPAPEAANAVLEAAKDQGLIIGKGGLFGNVLRISPMLNIKKDDADQAADLLDKAFAEGGKV
jgi:4-aminobutyrate aminotransferase-like enzyme